MKRIIPALVLAFCGFSSMASAGTPDAAKMTVPQQAGDAERHVSVAGGPVFITWYQGLPGRRTHVRHISGQDLDDTAYIRDVCTQMIRPQQPNIWKSEGMTTAENVVSDAGQFGAQGLAAGVPGATMGLLLKEGTGAGIVGGLVGGFDSHNRAKRNHLGQCMIYYQNDAVRVGDMKGGIHYIIDQDSTEGTPIGTSDHGSSAQSPGGQDDEDGQRPGQ
jgi:hypothetical protein